MARSFANKYHGGTQTPQLISELGKAFLNFQGTKGQRQAIEDRHTLDMRRGEADLKGRALDMRRGEADLKGRAQQLKNSVLANQMNQMRFDESQLANARSEANRASQNTSARDMINLMTGQVQTPGSLAPGSATWEQPPLNVQSQSAMMEAINEMTPQSPATTISDDGDIVAQAVGSFSDNTPSPATQVDLGRMLVEGGFEAEPTMSQVVGGGDISEMRPEIQAMLYGDNEAEVKQGGLDMIRRDIEANISPTDAAANRQAMFDALGLQSSNPLVQDMTTMAKTADAKRTVLDEASTRKQTAEAAKSLSKYKYDTKINEAKSIHNMAEENFKQNKALEISKVTAKDKHGYDVLLEAEKAAMKRKAPMKWNVKETQASMDVLKADFKDRDINHNPQQIRILQDLIESKTKNGVGYATALNSVINVATTEIEPGVWGFNSDLALTTIATLKKSPVGTKRVAFKGGPTWNKGDVFVVRAAGETPVLDKSNRVVAEAGQTYIVREKDEKLFSGDDLAGSGGSVAFTDKSKSIPSSMPDSRIYQSVLDSMDAMPSIKPMDDPSAGVMDMINRSIVDPIRASVSQEMPGLRPARRKAEDAAYSSKVDSFVKSLVSTSKEALSKIKEIKDEDDYNQARRNLYNLVDKKLNDADIAGTHTRHFWEWDSTQRNEIMYSIFN